ncbi:MAG: hypothetical protein H8F28_26585 [Fibrella sp.]|nr:hypothetical protein [Armatimonadota bacterium]
MSKTVALYLLLLWVTAPIVRVAFGAVPPETYSPAAHVRPSVMDAPTWMLDGVREVAAPGVPGSVCVYSKSAFPVVVASSGEYREAVVAAAMYGKGRGVAFGHDGYFAADALGTGDTGKLLFNSIRWAAGGRMYPRVGVLAKRQGGVVALLKARGGVLVAVLPEKGSAKRLKEFDVIVGTFSDVPEAEHAAYTAFAKAGGGLVGAETGWGWLSLHPGKTLSENGGNHIFAGMGLLWTGGMLERTTKRGFTTTEPLPDGINASNALDALIAGTGTPTENAQSVWTVGQALQALPPGERSFRARLARLRKSDTPNFADLHVNPVTMEKPLHRLFLTEDIRAAMTAPPESLVAHPSASSFPGAIPADAPRVTRALPVDTTIPEWHSTGLYAAPGEALTVTVSAIGAKLGLRVRIGTHTDTLWHLPTWKRSPEVTRSFSITAPVTRIANAFGGAILIDVPDGCPPATVTVTVKGAVAAPYFVRGKTDLDAWRRTTRHAPGPWAELQGDRCVLTVPSSVVRDLDDPDALMSYWDAVMDAAADLYAIPRERRRQERYCVDRQISAGYMHSGYPIMTGDDVAKTFVDLRILRGSSGIKTWGFYHELGHNHQKPAWSWDGCGEVTNNFFALYGDELFNGVKSDYVNSHPAIAPDARKKLLTAYFAAGAPYEKWKSDPFTALTFFIQLRQEFGWKPFQTVFREYEQLPVREHPRTDTEKHDQFLMRFSRAVGKNLGPFFALWGIPTTESARQSVSALPEWTPLEITDGVAKNSYSHP